MSWIIFLCWIHRRYRKTGPSVSPFSWTLNPIISGLWRNIFIVLPLCTSRCITAWMKGKFGLLPPTQWTARLYWGFLSYPRAVSQAIFKPYHVTWWGFADDSPGVSWLQLLLEYVCLLNHLPAGRAVQLFLSYPLCELCMSGREKREDTWKSGLQTWDNKGMEREYKILNFFFPFFLSRPGSQTSCHLVLPLGCGITLHPKHCLLFSCSLLLAQTDLDVALSLCTKDQYWALGQDFQSKLMIMNVLIW